MKKKLYRILGIYGAIVALIGLTYAYLIKTYWLYVFDWALVIDQTYLALGLGLVLMLCAFFYGRFIAQSELNARAFRVRTFHLAVGVLVILSLLTVFRTFIKISYALQTEEARFQTRYGYLTASATQGEKTKYQFATDYVSSHVATWTRHLHHLRGLPARGLEIGSFEGRSALWFLENILTHPDATITCVDIFSAEYEQVFDKNISISGLGSKVKKLKGNSRYVLRNLEPNTYDFAYIDGSHVAMDVLTDAVLVWDLVKPGGFVIFDDYEWPGAVNHYEGPARLPKTAIDAFVTLYNPYIDIVHREYQVIVVKRTSVDLNLEKFPLRTRAW